MRILMIAMSGVRAWNKDLFAAGMQMPGVIERQRVIASLPSLGLLTLAGLTPRDIHVDYREIRDLHAESGPRVLPLGYDLVAISSMTAQVLDGYEVARWYRDAGVPVIMGGLHISMLPEEALEHCTSVLVGEGESCWGLVIADLRSGPSHLKRIYRAEAGEEFDLADSPMPRYDLLEPARYNRLTVQTSRGCPHRCEFCASSILLTKRYKVKPVSRIVDEVRAIKRHWRRPFIELADDNSFVNRSHARELLTALSHEHVRWFTESDVSIARDGRLLDHMAASGCREVLIGLETPTAIGLQGVETARNWKLAQLPKYEDAIREIQSRGIAVNGCFILGLDGDGPEVFQAVEDFVERTSLYDVQLTLQTPFPGTPLLDRLRREGRMLHDRDWKRFTLFDITHTPRGMTVEQLERGLLTTAQRIFDPRRQDARRERFRRGVHVPGAVA